MLTAAFWFVQKYPICCGRLQLMGNEGHIECNSAGCVTWFQPSFLIIFVTSANTSTNCFAFAGAMFYAAVQSTPVDASEVALAATAAAYTQVRQCLPSRQQLSGSGGEPAA